MLLCSRITMINSSLKKSQLHCSKFFLKVKKIKYSASFSSIQVPRAVVSERNFMALAALLTALSTMAILELNKNSKKIAFCDMNRKQSAGLMMLEPTKEPSTGIMFPRLCNAMQLVGCGVRVKWRFIKVYAVGTYVDPIAMSAIKKESSEMIQKALLNPMYPRTIRIVMNRNLSIDKFTAAIIESLEPRMNGEDLDKLDEFKKLNPTVDLIEGAEMELTIRGDTLLYKNSLGGVGAIKSDVFCRALCDIYYGETAVSLDHRDAVVEGIKKL